jgi:hypothetical protein
MMRCRIRSSNELVRSSVTIGTGLALRSTSISSATSSSEFLGRSREEASPIYIHSFLPMFSCSSCSTWALTAARRLAWAETFGGWASPGASTSAKRSFWNRAVRASSSSSSSAGGSSNSTRLRFRLEPVELGGGAKKSAYLISSPFSSSESETWSSGSRISRVWRDVGTPEIVNFVVTDIRVGLVLLLC